MISSLTLPCNGCIYNYSIWTGKYPCLSVILFFPALPPIFFMNSPKFNLFLVNNSVLSTHSKNTPYYFTIHIQ